MFFLQSLGHTSAGAFVIEREIGTSIVSVKFTPEDGIDPSTYEGV